VLVLVVVLVVVLGFFGPTPLAGQIEDEDDEEDEKRPLAHLPADRRHSPACRRVLTTGRAFHRMQA